MPSLDINFSVIGPLHQNNDAVQHVKIPLTKDDWIPIHQNEVQQIYDYCVNINEFIIIYVTGIYYSSELPSLCETKQ